MLFSPPHNIFKYICNTGGQDDHSPVHVANLYQAPYTQKSCQHQFIYFRQLLVANNIIAYFTSLSVIYPIPLNLRSSSNLLQWSWPRNIPGPPPSSAVARIFSLLDVWGEVEGSDFIQIKEHIIVMVIPYINKLFTNFCHFRQARQLILKEANFTPFYYML